MLACMADIQRGEGRGNLGTLTGEGGTLYCHAPAFKNRATLANKAMLAP